jgi:hypothetical protein
MPKSKQEVVEVVENEVEEVVDNEPIELTIPDKPVKPKRTMSPEALEKLAAARVKAFAVKAENKAIRLKNAEIMEEQVKVESLVKLKAKATKKVAARPVVVEHVEPDPVEPEPEPEPVKKTKKNKKKPVVIIENDDSSSDEEADNVIYIKRRSSKKKAPPEPPPPVQPPAPPPVVRQEVSVFDKQLQLQRSALGMF